MKHIYLFAILFVACAKVPDYQAPPLEQDQSSVVVSEAGVNRQGCEFKETVRHVTLASCQVPPTFEMYYEQQVAILEYHWQSEEFLKSPAYKSQNKTTQIFLVAKNMASSRLFSEEAFSKEGQPRSEDPILADFYISLVQIADGTRVLVKFNHDSGEPTWTIDRKGSLDRSRRYFIGILREEIAKSEHPQSKFMIAVLDDLLKGG